MGMPRLLASAELKRYAAEIQKNQCLEPIANLELLLQISNPSTTKFPVPSVHTDRHLTPPPNPKHQSRAAT